MLLGGASQMRLVGLALEFSASIGDQLRVEERVHGGSSW